MRTQEDGSGGVGRCYQGLGEGLFERFKRLKGRDDVRLERWIELGKIIRIPDRGNSIFNDLKGGMQQFYMRIFTRVACGIRCRE